MPLRLLKTWGFQESFELKNFIQHLKILPISI